MAFVLVDGLIIIIIFHLFSIYLIKLLNFLIIIIIKVTFPNSNFLPIDLFLGQFFNFPNPIFLPAHRQYPASADCQTGLLSAFSFFSLAVVIVFMTVFIEVLLNLTLNEADFVVLIGLLGWLVFWRKTKLKLLSVRRDNKINIFMII
jgi:hypothetical protein